MRSSWGPFILVQVLCLVLLLGAAPAPAQPSTADSAPYPAETVAKPAKRPAHRTAAPAAVAKPAPATIPLPRPAPRPKAAAATPPAAPTPETKSAPEPAKAAAKAEPAKAAAQQAAPAKPVPESAKPAAKVAALPSAKPDAKPGTKPAQPARPEVSGAFAGISPADRLKIQQQLFWAGDYEKVDKGEDPATAAIKSFQKRNKAKITGELTDEQRAELVAAAERHEKEFGWSVVLDPATGIRIGIPTKMVPNAREAAHGTHWSSSHGEVQVETFRLKDADLAKLYEHEKRNPSTRKLSSAKLNDDNFFISGMQGLKYFSVRAKRQDGEIRGFTLLFDQMMEGIVAPVMVAMASAFSPFPERTLPLAELTKPVEYGTGLIVSGKGHIVTARRIAHDCQVIVVDGLGNAERLAEDGASGLALLRVYGAGKLPTVALPREEPTPGEITLVGIPDPKEQNGGKRLSEMKARLSGGHAIELRDPAPMAGFAGAAALDASGKFLGLMETRTFVLASAEPSVPPVRLVTAKTIRDFLAKQQVAPGAQGSARAAAVRVICVRK